MKIIFVCTGNTCRSPMAEGILKDIASKKGLDIRAESCGICAVTGDCVSEKSVVALKKQGIDISSHRARAFSRYMVEEDTLFVCMSYGHKAALEKFIAPEGIYCFSDIPDPFGKSQQEYDRCAEQIREETERLLEALFFREPVSMTEKDVGEIALIERECFSSPWSVEGIRQELKNDGADFFVLHSDGKVAGYIGSHIVLDECYIANVAVMPGFRRRGIGKRLVERAVQNARQKGCSFISLEVRVSNDAAISLYEKMSFERVGERKNFYSSPTENALIMTRYFDK